MADDSKTTRMVRLSDVLEVVSGVAPPDGYYHARDAVRIQTWQQAVARVTKELEIFLGGDHDAAE